MNKPVEAKKISPAKRRYTETEFETIKNTFADNEFLILAMRKFFLGMELTEAEKNAFDKAVANINVYNVISKAFLPQLDGNAPLSQLVDLWMTIKVEDKNPHEAYPHLLARKKLIEFLGQKLKVLKGEKIENEITLESLIFTEDKEIEEAYVDILSRTIIISHIEQQMMFFSTVSGTKTETVEETMKRIMQNSGQ